MNPYAIIDKYYPLDNELKHILVTHSRSVADKALAMARKHPELELDIPLLKRRPCFTTSVSSRPMPIKSIAWDIIRISVTDTWELT